MVPRPTHFLAFRITTPSILDKIQSINDVITTNYPALTPVKIVKQHVTLGVFNLPQLIDINTVTQLLDDWASKRMGLVFQQPIILNFANYGRFGTRVLFADVEQCENYTRLVDLATELNGLIRDAGYVGDFFKRKFNPHLTLLKKHRNSEQFRALWEELNQGVETSPVEFGRQRVESIQFLSMGLKDSTGYYYCHHELPTSPETVVTKPEVPSWR